MRVSQTARLTRSPTEGFFVGFPSYWNAVVAYFYMLDSTPLVNTVIIGTSFSVPFCAALELSRTTTSYVNDSSVLVGHGLPSDSLHLHHSLPAPQIAALRRYASSFYERVNEKVSAPQPPTEYAHDDCRLLYRRSCSDGRAFHTRNRPARPHLLLSDVSDLVHGRVLLLRIQGPHEGSRGPAH